MSSEQITIAEEAEEKSPFVIYTCTTPGYDMEREDVLFVPPARHVRHVVKSTREPKILFHKYFPEEEFTIWVDGNIFLRPRVAEKRYIELLGDADIVVARHNLRNCIYKEADAVLSLNMDSIAVVSEQMQRYRDEGYPEENGLAACGMLIRRNTPVARQFCEVWWREVVRGSHRDQLSFNYAAWKVPELKIQYLKPGFVKGSDMFRTMAHLTVEKINQTE